MQGPHQVAQKSMTTTLPARSCLVTSRVLPGRSRRVTRKSGAGLPIASSTAYLEPAASPAPALRFDVEVKPSGTTKENERLAGSRVEMAPAVQPNCSIEGVGPLAGRDGVIFRSMDD